MSREMKDSGVEWIGNIPYFWNIVRIGNLYFERRIKVSDVDYPPLSVTKNGILPQLKNVAKTDAHDDRKLVCVGDFCINSRSDRKGSCGISSYDGSVSLINTILVPKKEMNPDYYNWLFRSTVFSDEFYKWGHGIVDDLWTTNWLDMKHISIPYPQMSEQIKISDYLNNSCSKIDLAIEKTKQTIEEYKKLKQSIITEAVTKGIRKDRPMKDSGIEWIGEIPEDWETYRLANLYDERSEEGLTELPILTISINTGISDYEISDEDKDRVFIRCEDRTKYKRVYPGDLAYNMMRAWQGAFGAVRVNGMVSPSYVVAKPKKDVNIDSRYIEALLRTTDATREMQRYSHGIADFRLRLYWSKFKNICISLPNLNEQKEIANFIDDIENTIDTSIRKKEELILELEYYKKSLIYEYVTGKKQVPQS